MCGMAGERPGIGERLRRGLGRRRPVRPVNDTAPPRTAPETPAARLRGLGEPPAGPDQAPEAELDTLRGELVRELDRLAEDDGSSAGFRRIAS